MKPFFEMFYVNARLNFTETVIPFNVAAKSLGLKCPASELIMDLAITKPSDSSWQVDKSGSLPLVADLQLSTVLQQRHGGMLLASMFFLLALLFQSPILLVVAMRLFLCHE